MKQDRGSSEQQWPSRSLPQQQRPDQRTISVNEAQRNREGQMS